ncbi:MAG: hypothetical protein H6741_07920 [Alphaproteobacteria bacterium]|nr:hypothetical protein [Alphaproteobacteria bacterium]
MVRTLLLPLTLTLGCGEPCGTSSFYLNGGERWLAYEPCGDYGSFGSHFTDVGFTSLYISPDGGDVDAYADFVYALTPATELVFLTEHLQVGMVMDTRHLAGTGFHDPSASGVSPTVQDYSTGVVEVLEGPRDGDGQELEWRLSWNVSFGPLGDGYGEGYQHHVGEDWVGFDPALWAWEDSGHGGARPPDAP